MNESQTSKQKEEGRDYMEEAVKLQQSRPAIDMRAKEGSKEVQ